MKPFTFSSVLLIFIIGSSFKLIFNWPDNLVETYNVNYKGTSFTLVQMNIQKKDSHNKRIKLKYFAGNSAPKRYTEWAVSHEIICVTSGTYMSGLDASKSSPLGLSIESGSVLNNRIEQWDAIVLVYPNGDLVVVDLEMSAYVYNDILFDKIHDIKTDSRRKLEFLDWCKNKKISLFQSHLLAINSNLRIQSNKKNIKTNRRFLSTATDKNGNKINCIIQVNEFLDLYEASKRTLNLLNDLKEFNDVSLVNLDAGANDVLCLYDSNGVLNEHIHGSVPLHNSCDLIVFYYE